MLLFETRDMHAPEDAGGRLAQRTRVTLLAIFPEFKIVSSGLPVKDSCEVDLCLCRETAGRLLCVFWSTKIEEHVAIVVEVVLHTQKCVWRVPRISKHGQTLMDQSVVLLCERIPLRIGDITVEV